MHDQCECLVNLIDRGADIEEKNNVSQFNSPIQIELAYYF